ncbi:MAG TPA: DUF4124 domain-containing protein [Rhodanobacteraceae bacterium]|jgi:hypothetical protein|nr:DUF4124 domain-containing protein [Rhodanobacteraceae bacterium]
MRPSVLLVLAAVLSMAGSVAVADTTPATHYRWTDSAGVVHFGDTIPSSALAGGYDIVDDKGLVVRHVGRELTPAERKAAALAAAKAAATRRDAQQQKLEDAQLLSAYPTAKSLADSQQGQLLQMQTQITTLEGNLRNQEASLTELLAHAADLEHNKQTIPPYVHTRIADQRQTVNSERAALAQQRVDLANAKVRFAAQLDHYRKLRARYGGGGDSDSSDGSSP